MSFCLKNILLLCCLTLITGCASSYLTSSHSNIPEKKRYNKIVVVAKSKSQTIRHKFEQQISAQHVANGINAVTSNKLVPHSVITNDPTKVELESLRQTLISKGADGVIITSLVDKQDYVDVVSGGVSGHPYHMRGYGSYWGHYPATGNRIGL